MILLPQKLDSWKFDQDFHHEKEHDDHSGVQTQDRNANIISDGNIAFPPCSPYMASSNFWVCMSHLLVGQKLR